MDKLFAETKEKTKVQTEVKTNAKSAPVISRKQAPCESRELVFESETIYVEESLQKDETQASEIVSVDLPQNSYLNSFENKTIADFKREQESKEFEEFEKRKELLIDELYAPSMTIGEFQQKTEEKQKAEQNIDLLQKTNEEIPQESQIFKEKTAKEDQKETPQTGVIEKPNYDLLQSKTIKLTRKKTEKPRKKFSKKAAGVALACALAGSAIICVTNAVIIDQMSASFTQIDETYHFNLGKYLRDINNLDATKKGMEFLETYPDDVLDAGDVGEHSNWFDRLCNFLGGLFGG